MSEIDRAELWQPIEHDQWVDEWGEDPSAETYRKLARAALTALRAHDEAVTGDE